MITKEIICDGCSKKIHPGINVDGFYISVKNENYSTYPGGFVYAMLIHPPLDRDMQFHNVDCIQQWIDSQRTGTNAHE